MYMQSIVLLTYLLTYLLNCFVTVFNYGGDVCAGVGSDDDFFRELLTAVTMTGSSSSYRHRRRHHHRDHHQQQQQSACCTGIQERLTPTWCTQYPDNAPYPVPILSPNSQIFPSVPLV